MGRHRRTAGRVRLLGLLGLLVLLAAGCGSTDLVAGDDDAPSVPASTTEPWTEMEALPTTTTTTPTTTTTTGPASAATLALRRGDTGDRVRALQARLKSLGYWLGPPDGSYGDLTAQAVLAFQKAEGLERDAVAGETTLARLAEAVPLSPRTTSGDAIEIDLTRQLLLVVDDGRLVWVVNTSTGAPASPTPAGRYRVTRHVDGIDHGPLGALYRPAYFHRGIAVHGYPSVPAVAASHGCARVSSPAMDMLWATQAMPVGADVRVYR